MKLDKGCKMELTDKRIEDAIKGAIAEWHHAMRERKNVLYEEGAKLG